MNRPWTSCLKLRIKCWLTNPASLVSSVYWVQTSSIAVPWCTCTYSMPVIFRVVLRRPVNPEVKTLTLNYHTHIAFYRWLFSADFRRKNNSVTLGDRITKCHFQRPGISTIQFNTTRHNEGVKWISTKVPSASASVWVTRCACEFHTVPKPPLTALRHGEPPSTLQSNQWMIPIIVEGVPNMSVSMDTIVSGDVHVDAEQGPSKAVW